MFNLATAFRLVPPTPLQTGVGALACLFSLVAQAAQPDSPGLCLAVTELASEHTGTPSAAQNNFPNSLSFRKLPRWTSPAEPARDTFWTTSIRWHLTDIGNHASLSPRLRLETKESRIEIRPLQRSVWFSWRKALP